MFLLPKHIRRLFETEQDLKPRTFPANGALAHLEPWDTLSFREQEVVALIHMMYRNDEMADILAVSTATVKTHLQHVFTKLNARSKREVRLLFKDWSAGEWWDAHH